MEVKFHVFLTLALGGSE